MIKKQCIIFFLLAMLLLGGCSSKSNTETQQENTIVKEQEGAPTESKQEEYYLVTELAIPSSTDTTIMASEDVQGIGIMRTDYGKEQIVRNTNVYINNYQNTDFYIQIYDFALDKWSNLDVKDSAFEIKDTHYDGIDSTTCFSLSQEAYATAYILPKEEEEKTQVFLCKINSSGVTEVCGPFFGAEERSDKEIFLDKNGNIYLYAPTKNVISCYDSKLSLIKTVNVPGKVYGLLQNQKEDDVFWYGLGVDYAPMLGNLSTGESLMTGIKNVGTDYRMAISPDGVFYFADTQSVWRLEEEIVRVYSFAKNDYLLSEIYGMLLDEDGTIRLLTKLDGELVQLTMQKTDEEPKRQEIVVALGSADMAFQKCVARFNRQNNQYHVTLLYPEDMNSTKDYIQQINLEISEGKGPDLLGDSLVADPESYLANSYIDYVTDVVDNPALYLDAALEDNRTENGYIGIPYECNFSLAAYNKEFVGDKESLTLSEFMKLVEESDAKIIEKGLSGVGIVYRYGLYDDQNTEFIDWERGKSNLAGPAFIQLLEFAKEYADDGLADEKDFAYQQVPFSKLSDIKSIYSHFNGNAGLLGFPCYEGNGIYVNTSTLYLNNSYGCKEGAKEFLRFLISEKEQERYATYNNTKAFKEGFMDMAGVLDGFPIVLSAYEAVIKEERETDKDNIVQTDQGTIYLGTPYTDDMIAGFQNMLKHTKANRSQIKQIENIVYEELTPYFAGEISAEEAAKKLDNRVQLYLDER